MSDAATDVKTYEPSPGPVALREEFLDLIGRDLLGPCNGPDEEVDESRVTDRYLLGMLAPKNAEVNPEDDESFEEGTTKSNSDDGEADPVPNRAGSMLPSSIGMSFVVEAGVESLEIEGAWGRYERTDSETLETNAGNPKQIWKRFPCGGTIQLPLADGPIPARAIDLNHDQVVVRGVVRPKDDGSRSVTLFFVNEQTVHHGMKGGQKQPFWLFQVEFKVRADDGRSIFLARTQGVPGDPNDPHVIEERSLEMAYRLTQEFSVGHGTATTWTVDSSDVMRASELATSAMPRYEVEQMAPRTAEDGDVPELAQAEFRMNVLAEASDDALIDMLSPLADGYEAWINTQAARLPKPEEHLADYQDVANRSIASSKEALKRIREGIELLRTDGQARDAFRFANLSMWRQRTRSIHAQLVRRKRKEAPEYASIDVDDNRKWRPFQLAFVLLNLASTSDPAHEDRCHPTKAIADLLWFPTGGGKTEAYLGLAAYAIGLRRLQGELGGLNGMAGVTVLMRYTLRLLTLQQFQRAAALVCAMETIRREALAAGDERWGKHDEPFSIGLWVGGAATPNWLRQSHEVVRQAKVRGSFGAVSGTSSPAQIPNCPWCGWELGPNEYFPEPIPAGQGRTLVCCKNHACAFSQRKAPEGLPVITVDEEIYRRVPTILIGTVDKFAQMPWNGLVQTLFGKVEGYCPRHGYQSPDFDEQCNTHKKTTKYGGLPAATASACSYLRPPDLIIQDELHLISGPLGSMVGLYETAIDDLCSWDYPKAHTDGSTQTVRVRPKVVASTATVRNAKEQVRQLFCRRLEVFPPPGIDSGDNFFALQREPSERYPGRLYLGVCATGRNLKLALIRAFTAELMAGQMLYEKYGDAADPYMTLVGYFNSLRELGGMRRLVDDDIRNRLRQYDTRGFVKRYLNKVDELTSRVSSIRIPGLLDQLEKKFTIADEEARAKAKAEKTKYMGGRAFDVLLATSMISVGVDIERLGLMTVGGQPKGTAEYIQASSRVGRKHPGVVVTVYNWARPRDLSHYERFGHYHACFYRFVESLSVTPFAERAVDRGLAALLVGEARMKRNTLNANDNAGAVQADPNFSDELVATIERRVTNVGNPALGNEVKERLVKIADEWKATASRIPALMYKSDGAALLKQAGDGRWDRFTCLNSMRDVEATTALVLMDDGMTSLGGGS